MHGSRLAWATTAVVLLAAALVGAPPAPAATVGTIEGIVRNGATGEPERGVRVTLYSGSRRDQKVSSETVRTGPRGRFQFRRLPAGERHVYAIDAEFEGGLFAGGAVTIPDDTKAQPVIEVTLRVWPTTDDPRSIRIARDDLFVVAAKGNTASMLEKVTVVNDSEHAYIGRAAAQGSRAALGFALPSRVAAGVTIVGGDFDVPQIVETSFGFATTVAVPPGEHEIAFAYTVEGAGGTYELSRPAVYPVLEASVYAPEEFRITANRLSASGSAMIEGTRYLRYASTETIEAGDAIQVVATAEADAPAITRTGGLALAVAVALGAGAFALARLSFARKRPKPATVDRQTLVEEIARLDTAYRAGDVDPVTWDAERTRLKARIRKLPAGR